MTHKDRTAVVFRAQRIRKRDTPFPMGSRKKQHTLMEPEIGGLQIRLHRLSNTCNNHISLTWDRNKPPFYPFFWD